MASSLLKPKRHQCTATKARKVAKQYIFKPFVFSKLEISSAAKPEPRSGHRIVCNNKDVFSFGGYNPNVRYTNEEDDLRPLYREVWKLNYSTRTWKKLEVANIPAKLASNTVFMEGNLVFVYGGSGLPFGDSNSNKLYYCDLSKPNLSFSEVETQGQHPDPGYGQASFRTPGYFYTVGGTSGFAYTCDVHRLNMKTRLWEGVAINSGQPNFPGGRYRHGIAVYDDKCWIFGGGTSWRSFGFMKIPTFDLKTFTWSSVTTIGDGEENSEYPLPRKFHSTVTIPEYTIEGKGESRYCLIIGGNGHDDIMLDDSWILDMKLLVWKKITSLQMANPTFFHDGCLNEFGKMFIFGGICKTGKRTQRTANIYTAWTCIPKLAEICWDACNYFKLFNSGPNDNLERIPFSFKRRLEE